MRGDALASGQRSATFAVAPNKKFDEGQMRDDLRLLPSESFMLKYMITQREYDLINHGDEEKVNAFAQEMKEKAEFYERAIAGDEAQAESLKRECFLTPFTTQGYVGRVIVDRDEPATPKGERGRLLIPKVLRKEKTLLPTTGHVIKETIEPRWNDISGKWEKLTLLGKRVLFSPMSGSAICFKNYPVWIQLELSEIMALVDKEDAQVEEQTLEPMV